MGYNRDITEWESADGSKYLIKDLSTPHLVNILNWTRKHKSTYRLEIVQFLEKEAELRQFTAFVTNGPIPVKQDDGWWKATNMPMMHHITNWYYKNKTEWMMKIQAKHGKNCRKYLKWLTK